MAAQTEQGQFILPPTRGEAVVSRLREEILDGTLAPGAPIRDVELAERLGVSITPIRESVAVLIAEGLVETLPNKRRCVAVLTQRRAQDLMDVLGVVVSAGLERVSGSPDRRRTLAKRCRDFAVAAETRSSIDAEAPFRRFAEELLVLVDNEELKRAAETVVRRALGMIRLYPSGHLMPLWAKAFHDIADLVIDDSAAAATRARTFFSELVTTMAEDRAATAAVGHEVQ